MKSWKTTLSGIFALAMIGFGAYQRPPKTAEEIAQVGAAVVAAVGLIAAKDSNVSGPPPVVTPPTTIPPGA